MTPSELSYGLFLVDIENKIYNGKPIEILEKMIFHNQERNFMVSELIKFIYEQANRIQNISQEYFRYKIGMINTGFLGYIYSDENTLFTIYEKALIKNFHTALERASGITNYNYDAWVYQMRKNGF